MNIDEMIAVFEDATEDFDDEVQEADMELRFLNAIKAELIAVQTSVPLINEQSEDLRVTVAYSRIPGLAYLLELY